VVSLDQAERQRLESLTKQGRESAQVIRRAHTFLQASEGRMNREIAETFRVSEQTVINTTKSTRPRRMRRRAWTRPCMTRLARGGAEVGRTRRSGVDAVGVQRAAGWVGEGYDGVHIFAPDGTLIGRIHLPEACANLCFGGVKRNRLFIAASQSLYAVYVETQGATAP